MHRTKCHLGQVGIGQVGIAPIDLGQIGLTPILNVKKVQMEIYATEKFCFECEITLVFFSSSLIFRLGFSEVSFRF